MAHDPGPSARGQRLLALGAVCALAAATAVAFGRVFSGAHTVGKLVLVAVASALLAGLLERRNLVLATALSAVGLLVTVGVLIFPHTTVWGLPTLDTLHAIREAVGEIGRQADQQVAPTPPFAPLFLAATTALWAAIFSAHALAIRAGSPLLSLLPPVALIAFTDTVLEETERPLYGVLFLATALLVVFVDGLRRVQRWGPAWAWPGNRRRLSSTTGRGARRVAILALGVATVVPIALPGFGTNGLVDLSSNSGDGAVHVSALVSIRSALQQTDPVELFQVRSPVASYWRTSALDSFDGVTWDESAGLPSEQVTSTGTTLTALLPGATRLDQVVTIGAQNAILTGVPLAYPATRIDYPAPLTLDRELGTLAAVDDTLPSGTSYTVESSPTQPTPAQLRAEVFPVAAADPRYTSYPQDLPPEIRDVALGWIRDAGATTTYDQILAIQDHLNLFRYDPTVPARDDSFTLKDFLLTTRTGFCQQFASAMAVMLRTLGIPARVAVGFTQGAPDPNQRGLWHVMSNDAHAWVEVRFPTYGWLAFEPTPGRVNPIAEVYDDPGTTCVTERGVPCTAGPDVPGGPRAGGGAADHPNRSGRDVKGGTERLPDVAVPGRGVAAPAGGNGVPTSAVVAVLGLLVLLGLVLYPPLRALRRRLRRRRAGHEPRAAILATYDVFDARATDLGWGRRTGETVREYRQRVAAAGVLGDGDLGRLASLTDRAAYAGPEPDHADVLVAEEAARTTLRDLRRHVPFGRRVAGWYRPDRPQVGRR